MPFFKSCTAELEIRNYRGFGGPLEKTAKEDSTDRKSYFKIARELPWIVRLLYHGHDLGLSPAPTALRNNFSLWCLSIPVSLSNGKVGLER